MSGGRETGLAGRCVIVTGAARGQGAAHARAFAAEGARVVITDVLDDLGAELAAELGDSARYVHLDVTSEAEWAAAVEAAVAAFGPARVLISNAGMLGTPNALAYVTSKWAVRGMTKAAAAELGKHKIRVNSIHPGAVATPLLTGDGLTEEAFVERGRDRLAVPRIAAPEEISPAVIYFASDLSGYASGSELLVDGGWAIG